MLSTNEIARHTIDNTLFYHDVISGYNFIINFVMTNGKIFEITNCSKIEKKK